MLLSCVISPKSVAKENIQYMHSSKTQDKSKHGITQRMGPFLVQDEQHLILEISGNLTFDLN